MTTKEFIEKAIEGGYSKVFIHPDGRIMFDDVCCRDEILLDPLAWQAVGKVEGWPDKNSGGFEGIMECWESRQIQFVIYLQNGKSLEEALSLI